MHSPGYKTGHSSQAWPTVEPSGDGPNRHTCCPGRFHLQEQCIDRTVSFHRSQENCQCVPHAIKETQPRQERRRLLEQKRPEIRALATFLCISLGSPILCVGFVFRLRFSSLRPVPTAFVATSNLIPKRIFLTQHSKQES